MGNSLRNQSKKLRLILLINSLIIINKSYACISNQEAQDYSLQIASQEVVIAGIPQYKKAILADRPDKYDLTTNKVELINAYKKAHLKDPLNQMEIMQINTLEEMKKNYINERGGICK